MQHGIIICSNNGYITENLSKDDDTDFSTLQYITVNIFGQFQFCAKVEDHLYIKIMAKTW